MLEREKDLCGFNVTIPHKSGIIRYLDRIDPAAGKIGAVNLVLVHRDNTGIRLAGFNTDAPAFRATLPEPFPYRHALVLGTGGAAKATGYVLESLGTEVLFVTRNAVQANSISYEDLNRQPGLLDRFTFIVNATPVGMSPQTKDCPGIPWDSIGPAHYLYDLIYNPERTLFLEKGSERGARIQNGTEMFYGQAEAGFRLFKENYF